MTCGAYSIPITYCGTFSAPDFNCSEEHMFSAPEHQFLVSPLQAITACMCTTFIGEISVIQESFADLRNDRADN